MIPKGTTSFGVGRVMVGKITPVIDPQTARNIQCGGLSATTITRLRIGSSDRCVGSEPTLTTPDQKCRRCLFLTWATTPTAAECQSLRPVLRDTGAEPGYILSLAGLDAEFTDTSRVISVDGVVDNSAGRYAAPNYIYI